LVSWCNVFCGIRVSQGKQRIRAVIQHQIPANYISIIQKADGAVSYDVASEVAKANRHINVISYRAGAATNGAQQ
jgi:hypothetical protein